MAGAVGAGSAAFGALLAMLALAAGQAPVQIPFNTNASRGPGGPWNFITLSVGSGPASNVDFYPMLGDAVSLVVAQSACTNSTTCPQPSPGYYDSTSESAANNPQNINTSFRPVSLYDSRLTTQLGLGGYGYFFADSFASQAIQGQEVTVSADNTSMFVALDITARDGGNISYTPLSLLSLEPDASSHTIATGSGTSASTSTLLQAYINSTDGASSAFGLHIGSAAFGQPGSLFFGGYDQNRIIERPARFDSLGTVPLNHISFGTSSGASPWTGLPDDFLSSLNLTSSGTETLISPQVPHLYFPRALCDQFARHLPMKYDSSSNLYLWNTSDPLFESVVTSPSYMNFTFGDNQTTSIRVPFALLNLTLTSPIVGEPTQYFPCSPQNGTFNLGRAFLQSTFLMQGYTGSSTGIIVAAQAPGPSVNGSSTQNPVNIDPTSLTVTSPSNAPTWEDTWKGHLTPLSAATSGGASPSSAPDSGSGHQGLSGGAIAGIVIGVLAGVALIVAAALIFLRRRRTKEGAVAQKGAPPPGVSREKEALEPTATTLTPFTRSNGTAANGIATNGTATNGTTAGSGAATRTGVGRDSGWGVMPVSSPVGSPRTDTHDILSSTIPEGEDAEASAQAQRQIPDGIRAHELPGESTAGAGANAEAPPTTTTTGTTGNMTTGSGATPVEMEAKEAHLARSS